MEAGVIIGRNGEPLYWHLPANRTVVSLPDSRDLWDIFWEHREAIKGFAHSHPGVGVPFPSITDVSTFSGIELALGKRLDWWITSEDVLTLVQWIGPSRYDYRLSTQLDSRLPCVDRLRLVSTKYLPEGTRRREELSW